MKRSFLFLFLVLGLGAAAQENADERTEPVYKINKKVDIPLTAVTAGWSLYAFTQIYSKENLTQQEFEGLDRNKINGFDRWAVDVYSPSAAKTSDAFFYGSMPLPILLLADKQIRRDAGKIGFLYLEAMSITGLLYTGSTYLFDRYRPATYYRDYSKLTAEEQAELRDDQLNGGAKNAFFAGHVALVGTSTFFMAKVFSDYHPESRLKGLMWGAAVVATGTTAYLRHMGGKHFPSDILIGTAVGTLSGILVPSLHKNPILKNPNLSIMPFSGRSHGLAVVYKL
jgi:hypothetical protein